MVEGHSVHRLAAAHTARLVGRAFKATSPNGRFTDGARAINNRSMSRIEAVGKNLLVFFGGPPFDNKAADVVHIHFGMSGMWSVHDENTAPPVKGTTRLRLEGHGLVSHLSAMTCVLGDESLWENKKKVLGEDPLREDSDPERLWPRVKASGKTIGFLLMDQSFFPGVGNIYRAEILFKSGVHPEVRGAELTRREFEVIWGHAVALLRRGFQCGSILTVDESEALALGKPKARRYIYNQSKCVRCETRVLSWDVAGRTCYACPTCQPRGARGTPPAAVQESKVFLSHCAGESLEQRLRAPAKLTVAELRAALAARGEPTAGLKKDLVERLVRAAAAERMQGGPVARALAAPGLEGVAAIASAQAARREKEAAGESRAVEHVAEHDTTARGAEVQLVPLAEGRRRKATPRGTPAPDGGKRPSAARSSRAKRKLEMLED
jgi:formamidopyrimidine-DNA glycosylase